jgi:predicted phosphodiesterase
MKYGLLADIHESVEWLTAAIRHLVAAGVDELVVLGDIFETGQRLGKRPNSCDKPR